MVLLSGCSLGSKPSGQTETQNPAQTGPVQGGTLTVANVTDITNLDPAKMVDDPTWAVGSQIYNWLVELSPEGQIVPSLATEWKPSDDGKAWTVRLRQGVKFQDGTPFDAAAVKAHFERVVKPETASPFASDFGVIQGIETPDDYTVVFKLKNPYAPFLTAVLMSNGGAIPSPSAIEKWGKDYSQHPVGTGPFMFESWTPGQNVVLVRNKEYWGDKPYLDKVVFRPIPEPATRLAELQAGGVDLLVSLQPNDVKRLEADNSVKINKIPYFNVHHIVFNTKKPPLDDIEVRKALSLAIDVDTVVGKMLSGIATRAYSVVPEASWGFDQKLKKPYAYDPKEAARILEADGWKLGSDGFRYKNGKKLSLTLFSPNHRYPNDKEIMEFAQAQFKQIGIDAQLKVMEWGAYLDATYKRFEHEVMFIGWNLLDPDPLQFIDPFFKSDGWFRVPQWTNAELDGFLVKAGQSVSREERQQLYAKAQQIIADNYLVIPVFSRYSIVATAKAVEGLPPMYKLNLNKVWVSRK